MRFKVVTNHKEEKPSRNTADSMDRNNMRDKPITFIDLLDLSCHPANLIEKQQLMSFEKGWPGGFNSSLSVKRKPVKVGNNSVFDTNFIYSKVRGLQQSREIDII